MPHMPQRKGQTESLMDFLGRVAFGLNRFGHNHFGGIYFFLLVLPSSGTFLLHMPKSFSSFRSQQRDLH